MKRTSLRLNLTLLFSCCVFLIPSVSSAWQNGDTIYVDRNATGNGSGLSWSNAFTTIQGAIDSVTPGTEVNIFVAHGLYLEHNLILQDGIKLYGSFDGDEASLEDRRDVWTNNHWTVIDAERKHRVLTMGDRTEVNGFILRNGLRDHTLQSGLTIEDTRGGGIYIACDDDSVVRNNIIEDCAVYWQGGGIFIEGSCNNTPAAPLIEFNVIRSCTGYCGGGIEIDGVPDETPGGTDAIIRHNVLRNNPDGGTDEDGFGLELWTEYEDQCSPRMGDFYNNIIIGFHNTRDWNIDAADVWVWARNSVDRSFISQEWNSGQYLYNGCYKYDNPDNDNIFGSDPMFVDEANSDYHLRPGSPCIGAGRGGVDIGLFPYHGDNEAPVISSVASSGIASSGATITWSTNEPADSQVEYGLTSGYGSSTSLNASMVTTHSVTLSGLTASSTYHYRVKSKDAAGNLAVSGDYTFTTAGSSVQASLRLVANNYAYPGEGWDNAIDGDISGWDGTVSANASPPYAIFAFTDSDTKLVSKVRLLTDTKVGFSERWVTQFTVQVSTTNTNASSFTTLLNKASKSGGAWQEYSLAPTPAKYIKLILDKPDSEWRQIGEFEVYIGGTEPPPDTQPPVISAVASSRISSSGATITWSTDEASDSQVEYGLTAGYGSTTALDSAPVTNHSVALSGLGVNTIYHYRVKSKDAAGNLAVSGDYTFTLLPPPDTEAPVISSVASSGITSSEATITWSTNEPADSQVEYGIDATYGASTSLNSNLVTNHSVTLFGLSNNNNSLSRRKPRAISSGVNASATYHYRVKSKDAAGNLAVSGDYIFMLTPLPDTQAPVISNVASSGITSSGATITWSTDEVSDSQVEYGLTTGYGSSTSLNASLVTTHSAVLSGLSGSTLYHYRVKSKDAAGNLAVSRDYSFTTPAPPDTQAPTVPTGLTATAISTTQINLSWTASTDNVGVAGYRIYRDGSQISTTTNPSYQDTGRSPSTTYTYRVAAYDAVGNVSAQSSPASATTLTPPDTEAPMISSVASSGVTSSGATITWSTNEPADSQVEYGLTTSYGSSTPLNASLVTNHSMVLSGLSVNMTYHYRVKSKDASRNLAVSGDYTFVTTASSVRASLRLVANNYAYPGEGWDNAIDGDISGWDGTVTASASPPYAIFAFTDNGMKLVSKVKLLTDTGVRFPERWVTQFTVQVSTTDTNDSSFTTVLDKASKSGGAWEEYIVPLTTAKYIKLLLDKPESGWRQIGEFEVWVNP